MASGRETRRRAYTPALRFHALTAYFDALMARGVKKSSFRQRLLDQLDPAPGHRVIDLGCGTGTLAILLKSRAPDVEVVALDADPEASPSCSRAARPTSKWSPSTRTPRPCASRAKKPTQRV
jgi:trans-aconitate methyltransferase